MGLIHSATGPSVHFACELGAYAIASRLYWIHARRQPMPTLRSDRALLLGFAVLFAAVGSKMLHVAEHLPALLALHSAESWFAGKSVLGGLIGGTLGVELAKKLVGWRHSTGDAWVPALCAGLAVGRIGCQFSGVWDQTYGNATSLPWAWDYGDGVGRHPTALYEIFAVVALYAVCSSRLLAAPGARFAAFLAGYCTIRFALEFLKPPFGPIAAGTLPVAEYQGLSAIQWAALGGGIGYLLLLQHRLSRRPGWAH